MMQSPNSMNSRNEIQEAAAAWLVQRDRADWGTTNEVALQEWLGESTAHRVAYLRLQSAWQRADRLKALGAGVPHGQIPSPGVRRGSPWVGENHHSAAPGKVALPMTPRRRRTWGIAAGLVLGTLGLSGWYLITSRGSDYQTVIGGVEAVPLKDGSNITLNTNSEVRVVVTDTERRVDLARGEAFFHVAKDPKRPFVVHAGRSRVIAVGTQFSVRREGDEVSVVVIEGRVRLEQNPSSSTREAPLLLAAGGVARSDAAGVFVQAKPTPEAEQMLSWRSGYLMFHDTPLSAAVQEFNRYSTRQIVIEDSAIGDLKIGGNFRIANAEAFIRLLESGLPIRVEPHDDQIILRSR
jgi:transmembrane sensor